LRGRGRKWRRKWPGRGEQKTKREGRGGNIQGGNGGGEGKLSILKNAKDG